MTKFKVLMFLGISMGLLSSSTLRAEDEEVYYEEDSEVLEPTTGLGEEDAADSMEATEEAGTTLGLEETQGQPTQQKVEATKKKVVAKANKSKKTAKKKGKNAGKKATTTN